MSQWHREHPELAGTDADPWTRHESYRRALSQVRDDCGECGRLLFPGERGFCRDCKQETD